MVVKIARGTTGQVDFSDEGERLGCGNELDIPFPPPSWYWSVVTSPGGSYVALHDADSPPETSGWDVDASGNVTVPLTAIPGNYRATYTITGDEVCGGAGVDGNHTANYTVSALFEVVCMSIAITGLT